MNVRALLSLPLLALVSISLFGQEIDTVEQFQSQNGTDPKTVDYMISISGKSLPADTPHAILFPQVTNPQVVTNTATAVVVSFTGSPGYSLQQVVLVYKSGTPVTSKPLPTVTCSWDSDIKASFEYTNFKQVKWYFGKGVAKNFYVLQLSITNQCSLPIIVPLAGITLVPTEAKDKHGITIPAPLTITPYPLDSVTSIFNVDRTYNGGRAIFFNILAGATTVGSAIEQFLPPGFTQAVSVAGGGFTNGAKILFPDMSAQQLQFLTSRAFGSAEQLSASSGTVQKYIFVPKKNLNTKIATALADGKITINFVAIPVTSTGSGVANPSH